MNDSGLGAFRLPSIPAMSKPHPSREDARWAEMDGEQVALAYRTLWAQGAPLALPVLFALESHRGTIAILADGALELSEHPAGGHFLPRQLCIEAMEAVERLDPCEEPDPGRIDPLRRLRLEMLAEPSSFAALRFAMQLCPDWIGRHPPEHHWDGSGSDIWRRGSKCVKVAIRAEDPQALGCGDPGKTRGREAALGKELDALYERRFAQAAQLARALGPTAAVRTLLHEDAYENACEAPLWEEFFARREAAMLGMNAGAAPSSASPRRI